MRNAKLNNSHASGTVPPGRQQRPLRSQSESRFLADRALDAKTGASRAVGDIKRSLGRLADVRVCAKHHPWLLIGSAVAAGFFAGAMATRSATNKPAEARMNAEAQSQPNGQTRKAPRSKKSLLLSAAGVFLLGILRNVIQASIANAVVAKDSPPAEERAPRGAMDLSVVEREATETT